MDNGTLKGKNAVAHYWKNNRRYVFFPIIGKSTK